MIYTVVDSYGGVSLHRQSHGELFLALVQIALAAAGQDASLKLRKKMRRTT